jgi:hypothetical protein
MMVRPGVACSVCTLPQLNASKTGLGVWRGTRAELRKLLFTVNNVRASETRTVELTSSSLSNSENR